VDHLPNQCRVALQYCNCGAVYGGITERGSEALDQLVSEISGGWVSLRSGERRRGQVQSGPKVVNISASASPTSINSSAKRSSALSDSASNSRSCRARGRPAWPERKRRSCSWP